MDKKEILTHLGSLGVGFVAGKLHNASKETLFSDADFIRKYEKALEGIKNEDLGLIAKLNKTELVEWVNSPEAIRPFILKKFSLSFLEKPVPKPLEFLAQKMKDRIEYLEQKKMAAKESSQGKKTGSV